MSVSLSWEAFKNVRELDQIKKWTYYLLPDAVGWSPDGVGMYWYETYADAVANHG